MNPILATVARGHAPGGQPLGGPLGGRGCQGRDHRPRGPLVGPGGWGGDGGVVGGTLSQ